MVAPSTSYDRNSTSNCGRRTSLRSQSSTSLVLKLSGFVPQTTGSTFISARLPRFDFTGSVPPSTRVGMVRKRWQWPLSLKTSTVTKSQPSWGVKRCDKAGEHGDGGTKPFGAVRLRSSILCCRLSHHPDNNSAYQMSESKNGRLMSKWNRDAVLFCCLPPEIIGQCITIQIDLPIE